MNLPTLELRPIGVIHTPFGDTQGMPIQPSGAAGVEGTVEVYDEYLEGLEDLDGFSHIILLYHFHRSNGFKLRVVPFMDDQQHGLFATRAPNRPNPIGLSIVQLSKVENNLLYVQNVDILDGTPLLDIKPYVPAFDQQIEVRTGWIENANKRVDEYAADERFVKNSEPSIANSER